MNRTDEAAIIRSRELGGVAGYDVGVLHMASPFAFARGNIQNARTMPFPIAYECVHDVTLKELLSGDVKVKNGLVSAARRLEARGVRVIVGACGSFANFQRALTQAVSVPICASILVQVPWLLSLIPEDRQVGIVFADRDSFTRDMQQQCGIRDLDRIQITDCMHLDPFRALIDRPYTLEHEALKNVVTAHVATFLEERPQIAFVVLQCNELSPYASHIQAAIGRPVVDVNALIGWAHSIAARDAYL